MSSRTGVLIGELAGQAQVTIDTIRYYEKIGLLPTPGRLASGYRIYSPESLERLRFIRQARELGLSLDQIGELLRFEKNDRSACLKVQAVLAGRIADLDQRIETLARLRRTLSHSLAECRAVLAQDEADCCPVLEEIPHSFPAVRKKA